MKVEVRYSWRHKWGGRTVTSKVKLTEEQARKLDPDAVRLDHTREEFQVRDQPCEIDVANIDLRAKGVGTARAWPSKLVRPKTVPGERDFVPLPMSQECYHVASEGEIWTVTATTADFPPRVVYQGCGPVSVEEAV